MVPPIWARARALIFDFDGVLCDSEPFWRDTYNQALRPYGVEIPEAEYYEFWSSKGEGLAGQIRRHDLRGLDEAAIEAAQRRAYRAACDAAAIPLFPEAAELLRRLTAPAAGRPLVIASNTDRPVVEHLLRAGGAPVPPVIGGEGLNPKPAPDIFLQAARHLGLAPAATIVVEDTEKGIRAARAGGFPVLLVRNRYNRPLQLEADAEVESLAVLLGWTGA
jgi:HAD superfamily hydrolase (TIGR01509 family)